MKYFIILLISYSSFAHHNFNFIKSKKLNSTSSLFDHAMSIEIDSLATNLDEFLNHKKIKKCLLCTKAIEKKVHDYYTNQKKLIPKKDWAFENARIIELDYSQFNSVSGIYNKKNNFQSILKDGEFILTFDDGPYYNIYTKNPQSSYYRQKTTETVLEKLNHHNAPALFFLLGSWLDNYTKDFKNDGIFFNFPDYTGHTLAHHTYYHHIAQNKSFNTITKDIEKGRKKLFEKTGICSPFFRFPGGSDKTKNKESMIPFIKKNNLITFHWDILSNDTSTSNFERIKENVLSQMRKKRKGVILFHDTRRTTAKFIDDILLALKTEGFRPVKLTWDKNKVNNCL